MTKINLTQKIIESGLVALLSEQDTTVKTDFLSPASRDKFAAKIKRFKFVGKAEDACVSENLDDYTAVAAVGLGEVDKKAIFKSQVTAFAKAVKLAINYKVSNLTVFVPEIFKNSYFELGFAVAYANGLAMYKFDEYKKDDDESDIKLDNVSVLVERFSIKMKEKFAQGVEQGAALARGINLARDLVNHPPVKVNSEYLVRVADEIAMRSGGSVTVNVLERADCERLGMGAYLAVAKGSDNPPKFIILTYEPDKATESVAYIGKSITFDSGGLSLKPSDAMMDMKMDMAGGASVLGLFSVIADLGGKLNLKKKIFGILPTCENMPSGHATCPGDIVRSMSGKTIEILNTDAEGRLALADAIVYAQKELKAKKIVDLATLTGACMVALGTEIAALLGNNIELNNLLLERAKVVGEPLWELPLHKNYRKDIDSDVADIKNISSNRYGGAIIGGLFLQDFVENDTAWAHLDIAGPAFSTVASDLHPKGATGYGVTLLFDLLDKI